MKKSLIALMLIVSLLCLASCSQSGTSQTTEPPQSGQDLDMQSVYSSFLELADMPEMIVLDADMMLNYCGIKAEDCVQAVVAICSDGLRTDEVWLIEATDETAVQRLKDLADARLTAKGEESETYSPEQYAIVQDAEVIQHGKYLAVLVSPLVDDMTQLYKTAAGI